MRGAHRAYREVWAMDHERQAALERQAASLIDAGAPAQAFEALRKQGWREPSYYEGSGLQPCPSDCGVCHPVLAPVRRNRNGKRRGR